MKLFLFISQVIISLLLIILIMVQPRGMGLGSSLSGEGLSYSPKGAEKIIFMATIILAILFLLVTLANLFVAR